MVFESLVADVLNKVLGDYIENLDRKHLKIGIWGGDVVLQGLRIRETALDDLDLPVKIVYGYLEKLMLKIPWKHLYTQPVTVNIEGFYVLVSPNNNIKYNAEKEAKYEMELKKAAMDALEEARKKELEKDLPKPQAGFAEKLTAQIVNNLQVQITNVHLRYEDITTTGSPFSFGISMDELELYTTDSDWEKCYLAEQLEAQVFKIANLSCLSAYLNCGGQLYGQDKSQLAELFKTNIARKDFKPTDYHYVVGPISCNAKLKLNMKPDQDEPPFQTPKIDLTVEMEMLNVGLTNKQFINLTKLGDAMNRQQLAMPYRKYRPYNTPIKGHAKEWWRFAITSILEEHVRRPKITWTWKYIQEHRQRCRTYALKYKEHCLSQKPPASLVEACNLLEQKLDIFNLLLIRERVNIDIAQLREVPQEKKKGWFSGWGRGGNAKKEGQNFAAKFENEMTGEEKAKMYMAIGYEKNVNPTDLPESYEAIKMNFKLITLEVGLYKEETRGHEESWEYQDLPSLVLLQFSMTTALLTQRPAAGAMCLIASIRELRATGFKTGDYTPLLIESKITGGFNLLEFMFETNPLDKECDQRVRMVTRPLHIVYNEPTVLALVSAFKRPEDVQLSQLENAANAQISNIKERSTGGMQYMIDQKTVMDLEIWLMPNILILPDNGVYREDETSMLVVSLGDVQVSSTHRNLFNMLSAGEEELDILETLMENAYDRYTITVGGMQMLVVQPGELWQPALTQVESTKMHILRPISLQVIAALCVIDNDPRLPKMKVDIDLPRVLFNVSEDRIILALKVVMSMANEEQEQPKPQQPVQRDTRRSTMPVSPYLNKEMNKKNVVATTSQVAAEEITQYTQMEVNFSLGEIYFDLLQSSGSKEVLAETVEILSIDILRLEAYFVAKTYESMASIKLGDINIRQFGGSETVDMILTPKLENSSNYLLTVSCTMVAKISPEFSTKYDFTEQLIMANFEVLQIVLHQEFLLKLMEMANQFQSDMDAVISRRSTQDFTRSSAGGGDGIQEKMSVTLEEPVATTSQKKPRKNQRFDHMDIVKVLIIANLDQVGLKLTSQNRDLTELNVSKFVAKVIMKSAYTEVNIGLKNIAVLDLNPQTIHKNILTIVGKDAFYCQVVLFNKQENLMNNSDDMKITVDIGCLRIIFLNWFVAGVLNFVDHFSTAEEAITQASANAAENARQRAMNAYETATRMKLNIRIQAPIIIVPTSSQSLNALALDLGLMELTNNAEEIYVESEDEEAVIDKAQLRILDIKLSKVTIMDGNQGKVNEIDSAVGYISHSNIMNPMNFTLLVNRNLSFGWYKDVPELSLSGHLKKIELTLFANDYALVMMVMNCNLSEGLDEFPPKEEEPPKPMPRPAERRLSLGNRASRFTLAFSTENNVEAMKLNFKFDGVVINLMESEDEGLARFGIYCLSIDATTLDNGTMNASVGLCNIQVDDTRSSSEIQVRQYLRRKDWGKPNMKPDAIIELCSKDRNFLIDIRAIMKENDTLAEVRMRGFHLIVCIDFLLRLSPFFSLPADEKHTSPAAPKVKRLPAEDSVPEVRSTWRPSHGTTNESMPMESLVVTKKVNYKMYIEEPEIILVESLEFLDTSCIIFSARASLNLLGINDRYTISGEINSLNMYMCSFLPDRREITRHYIIFPCVISLEGSTPEEEGMHICLKLSDIIINVSPATIELLNKAMVSISSGEEINQEEADASRNFSTLWQEEPLQSRDHWFTRTLQEVEASKKRMSIHEDTKHEECVIEMPSVRLTIESGVGYYTKPLISLETRLMAVFKDWSSNLTAEGSLTISMNYYNQNLAEWEPIIEMNEVVSEDGIREYEPWELKFDMGMEKVENDLRISEEDEQQQAMYMNIRSKQTLEITLSKTCLGLLGELGEAFSQAIDEEGLTKPGIMAPYVLENDTGLDVSLNLRKGMLTLDELHYSAKAGPPSNSSIPLSISSMPHGIDKCIISSGGRAYLQLKDFSKMSEHVDDYNLYVKIGDMDKEIGLPVSKSDTRYFSLMDGSVPEPWGIVSEVKLEYGTTKINIHGIVSIHNHFTSPINIHRRNTHPTAKNFEDIYVGRAKRGEVFHVPLPDIYADSKELFFSLRSYTASEHGFTWNTNLSDSDYSQQVLCHPTESFETLYINVRRRKSEIYNEYSTKYTLLSAFYMIHLRPPLYLRNGLPIEIMVSVAGCSVSMEGANMRSSMNFSMQSHLREEFLDYGEKEVKPGAVLHLPTVRLGTVSMQSKSFLVIRVLQYLEKDWSCATEITDYFGDLTTWSFASYDSEMKVDKVFYVKCDDRHGSLMLTLFSPFWLINKTGLVLSYLAQSTSVDVLYHPPEYTGPILLTFRDKLLSNKKKASIRIDNGSWSDKIPLDVAGAVGALTCQSNNQTYHIGVHNHLTQNTLTKQVTFIPFYIVCNRCRFAIELQEKTRSGDPWLLLETDQLEPLWPKLENKHKLVVRVKGKVTPAFDYTEVVCTLLKLEDSKYGGINVDVQTTEGGVYITFTEYKTADAPGMLINHTTDQIVYYEKGTKTEHILNAKSTIMYAWDDPTGSKVIVFGKNKQETDLRRDNIGDVVTQNGLKALWVSFLDGLQRVLLFTESEAIAHRTESNAALQTITQSIDVRIHSVGFSLVNNESGGEILYLAITSSGVIWESKKTSKKRFKEVTINENKLIEAEYQRYLANKKLNDVQTYKLDKKFPINFDRMILKKTVERNIRRCFYPAIWVSRKSSPYQNQLHIKINRIQVDNQIPDPIFAFVLAPIPPAKSMANTTALKPFFECSMVQRIMPNSPVRQFKYARLLIQEFHFKVDIKFLTAIGDLFATEVSDDTEAKQFLEDVESIEQPLSAFFEDHSLQAQKSFYDNLHLGPLKIHLSFSMGGSDSKALPGFLGSVLGAVGVTLTEVNDVVFRLAYFEREYQFFTQPQLIGEIVSHYVGQTLKQLYVLVLGLDVLGNPYGLVVGLKKGVEDLFYEPFQGAIQGPQEFAEGLVIGVKSLFGHTVGGAAAAMSKITGAMGKGLAVLTFDEQYQRKRRRGVHIKPKNFHEGLARNSKGLVMGFVDGVTGVVTKPMNGAREKGVEGFFKGLGKGAIGLVTRPTSGVVDFASGSFDAVKRATEPGEVLRRTRPPRFQHYDFVLRPYCYMDALGNKILKEVDKSRYATTDNFIHCEEIIHNFEYIVVSNFRLLYVQRQEMFNIWTSVWIYLWSEISSVTAVPRGVQFTVKAEAKKMCSCGPKESHLKLVLVPNERKRLTLVEIIENQLADQNPNMVVSFYPGEYTS